MPLSEFQSFMKGKHDSGQPKVPNRSSPQSPFVPEHDFVELLWENGHVVQSNRPKKSPFPSAFPSLSGKAKEKEGRDAVAPVRDAVAPRSGRYGGIDALGNGLQATGPSGQNGLGGQDDELVPWLNCPIDDYCSEFLSEFSGINPNSLSSMVPTERISGFGQAARDVHGGAENSNGSRGPTGSSEASRMNSSPFFQFPQQYQMLSSGIVRPRESEVTMGAADQGHRGDLPATKIPKQDLTASMPMQAPNSSTPVMNFSHFSRPVALAKANLLGVDRARGSEKASTAASSNPLESALIEYAGGFKSVSASQGRVAPVTAKADLNPPVQPSAGMALVGHSSEAISQEDAAKDSRSLKKTADPSSRRISDHTRCQDSNFKAVGQQETENNNSCHEPAIASSSVCSAIGAGAAANDIRNRAKWRCTEGEESEYPSEQDHEDDSTDVVRRPVAAGAGGQGTSKKRSRAAEVHNLSERRRRDRINEKMRALQELIPNCNKVDKASMLDEAIEYLKTLQMQVQIMSMGGGLCVPPLMLPTGVQNMRAPHMGPFSPMAAVGMGMGMAGLGFGMGMFDMTRAPTLMPLPRVHGPPYPACASIPGTAGLHHGMPGSAAANLQMFGMPAGQPMPMSMPHPPPAFVPLVGGMATGVNPVPEEPVAEVQASDSTPPPPAPKSKDRQQLNTIEQAAAKTSTVDTPAESSGGRANRECFELPSMVQIDDQPPNVGGT